MKVWKRFQKENHYKQAVARAKRGPTGNELLNLVTHKMEQSDVGSVLAEICFLSSGKKSSIVTLENKTPSEIKYHKCFIARGREASYVGFDRNVPPKRDTSYSFEKHTYLSIDGCAAMIFFSATTCKPNATECFFVVAFRNYGIKTKPNKTALMILNSSESIEELSGLLQYAKVIANKNEDPDLPGCHIGHDYQTTFMCALKGQRNILEFPSIKFRIYMNNDNNHSQSVITVSHPETA
uniref:Uncharacterized protein n=1 Tax=Amphimedon queenslandica TaxID=400682 RepID=A0A1X7TR93_AMPQE